MNEDAAKVAKVIGGDPHAYLGLHIPLDSTDYNRVLPKFILGQDLPRVTVAWVRQMCASNF